MPAERRGRFALVHDPNLGAAMPLDEPTFLNVLDEYLGKLQSGSPGDRAALLAAHPELEPYVDCLEALEKLAPPPTQLDPGAMDADRTQLAERAPLVARPPSTHFGKFELLAELGRGGMGVVYKALQKDLGRIVALKMVLAGPLASREVIERFRDEARAVAGIQHPNITTVYEVGEVDGQGYIAIQYVGGASLMQRLSQRVLEPAQAARVVAAVARAVDHLHKHGVIHRDLKPSNILLDEQGNPFVTDFGLVKLLQGESHKTTTGAVLGTPSYMAPEQAAARSAEVGPASDVYSIGAVLFECLTGRPPFREPPPLDTLVQVLEGEPPAPRALNPSIPRELEGICLRCLEKAPERRYATAAALANDLEGYLNGEPVVGLQASPGRRLVRWARREPGLAARLGALSVSLCLVQANYMISGKVDPALHLTEVALMLGWGAASFVFQKLQNAGRWPEDLPFAWAGTDLLFWTLMLIFFGDAVVSPVLIGYPCLVAASGLWFRVRLVWFTTILSLLSYGGVLLAYLQTHEQAPHGLHTDLIFGVGLVALGYVVAYQVHRVKALSRYYEHRPLTR